MSGSGFKLNPAFAKALEDAVGHGLDVLANEITKTSQSMMRESKSGRDYRNKSRQGGKSTSPTAGRRGARNISSAPGEAPAVQYGDLIRSVQWEKAGTFIRHVGSNLPRALWLEMGTKKIQARPFLRPAYTKLTGHEAEVCFEGKLK